MVTTYDKETKAWDIAMLVCEILFGIIGTIFAIQLILKLTDHSPEEIQLLYIGFGSLLMVTSGVLIKIGRVDGKLERFMKQYETERKENNDFKKEMHEFKEEMIEFKTETKKDFEWIKKEVKIMSNKEESLFGAFKKMKSFTTKERKKIWKDKNRE